MDQKTLLTIIAIIMILVFVIMYKGKESFCPYGYCPTDTEEYKKFYQNFNHKYPTNCNFALLGYDNPYIYPYNYFMNQNHPIDRFKFPGWVRRLSLTEHNEQGFPGFAY